MLFHAWRNLGFLCPFLRNEVSAMANRIMGITVEIGGDTTKLQTALKGVNGQIKSTQQQLKDVDKLLKLDPGNTELLACITQVKAKNGIIERETMKIQGLVIISISMPGKQMKQESCMKRILQK